MILKFLSETIYLFLFVCLFACLKPCNCTLKLNFTIGQKLPFSAENTFEACVDKQNDTSHFQNNENSNRCLMNKST